MENNIALQNQHQQVMNVSPAPLPKLQMKTKVIQQAGGSAFFQIGNTKVICSVYGPRVSPKIEFSGSGKLWCQLNITPFARKQKQQRNITNNYYPARTREERLSSVILEEALSSAVRLENYPKSIIEVYVMVLEDDGAMLSAAISCASLALADSGIEMFGVVSACTIGYIEQKVDNPTKEVQFMIDPCTDIQSSLTSSLVLSYVPAPLCEVTHIVQFGTVSQNIIQEMLFTGIRNCSERSIIMGQVLTANLDSTESNKTVSENKQT